MQRREPQVRKVELKKSQFFNGLAKPSPSPLLSSAKNSKTCVTVYNDDDLLQREGTVVIL